MYLVKKLGISLGLLTIRSPLKTRRITLAQLANIMIAVQRSQKPLNYGKLQPD